MILLVGRDAALLEGISQALAILGHPVKTVASLEEAGDVAPTHGFDVAIVQRALLSGSAPVPLKPGGVLVLFRAYTEGASRATLSPSLARLLLAELELPLERHRLVALIRATLARMRVSDRHGVPPNERERGSDL